MADSFVTATIKRTSRKRDAGKLLAFVMCWCDTHAELGRRPTVDEYAEKWNMDVRTAYREQANFREVWPEFLTPSDVALALGLDPAQPKWATPVRWGLPAEVA